jgi:hypothetical protein
MSKMLIHASNLIHRNGSFSAIVISGLQGAICIICGGHKRCFFTHQFFRRNETPKESTNAPEEESAVIYKYNFFNNLTGNLLDP